MSYPGPNIRVMNIQGGYYDHGTSQRGPAYGSHPATYQNTPHPARYSQPPLTPHQHSQHGDPRRVQGMQGSGGGQGGGNLISHIDNSTHDNSTHHFGDAINTVTYNSGSQSNIGRVSNANFGANYGTITQNNRMTTQNGPPSNDYNYAFMNGSPASGQWDDGGQHYDQRQDYSHSHGSGPQYAYHQGYRDDPQNFQQRGHTCAQSVQATVNVQTQSIWKSNNPFRQPRAGAPLSSSTSAIPPLPSTSGSGNSGISSATQERGTEHRPPPSNSYPTERGQTRMTKNASTNAERPITNQAAQKKVPKPSPSPDSDSELDSASDSRDNLDSDTDSDNEVPKHAAPTAKVLERPSPALGDGDPDIEETMKVVQRDEAMRKGTSSKARTVAACETIATPSTASKTSLQGSPKHDSADSGPATVRGRGDTESTTTTRKRRVSFASEPQVREFLVDEEADEVEERRAAPDLRGELQQTKPKSSGPKDKRSLPASRPEPTKVQPTDDSSSVDSKTDDRDDDSVHAMFLEICGTNSILHKTDHGSSLFDEDFGSYASSEASPSGLDQSEKDSLGQAGSAPSSSVVVSTPSPALKGGKKKLRMSLSALSLKSFGGAKDKKDKKGKKGKEPEGREEPDYGVVGAPGVRED